MNLFLLLALILSPGLGFAEKAKTKVAFPKFTKDSFVVPPHVLALMKRKPDFIGPLTKAEHEAKYGISNSTSVDNSIAAIIEKNETLVPEKTETVVPEKTEILVTEKTEAIIPEKTETLVVEKTESLPISKPEVKPIIKESTPKAKEEIIVDVKKEESKLPPAEELIKETAMLTDAPYVPAAITRTKSALVTVDMEIKEHVMEIAKEIQYNVWTFGGRVPGKFIRVRHGDSVQFNLHNHQNNKVQHNIDLHAVTGPGGGAAVTGVLPGHTATFGFKALNPGLYVYHCATAPVAEHIANGMYGLILVQPHDYVKVDQEYYIMQSEFYTKQEQQAKGLKTFSMRKAVMEQPSFVVFNGHKDGLTRIKLTPNVGDKVRLYVGNGGPNLISAFHIIGEIFDKVYLEGNTSVVANNVQTTAVLPGGSTIVEFTADFPGQYVLVDHSITRTFHKGTLGLMQVEERASDKTPEAKENLKKIYSSFEARPDYRGK